MALLLFLIIRQVRYCFITKVNNRFNYLIDRSTRLLHLFDRSSSIDVFRNQNDRSVSSHQLKIVKGFQCLNFCTPKVFFFLKHVIDIVYMLKEKIAITDTAIELCAFPYVAIRGLCHLQAVCNQQAWNPICNVQTRVVVCYDFISSPKCRTSIDVRNVHYYHGITCLKPCIGIFTFFKSNFNCFNIIIWNNI